jgi:hypothetical protein
LSFFKGAKSFWDNIFAICCNGSTCELTIDKCFYHLERLSYFQREESEDGRVYYFTDCAGDYCGDGSYIYDEYINGDKSKEDIRRYALDMFLSQLLEFYEDKCMKYIDPAKKLSYYRRKARKYYKRRIVMKHIIKYLLGEDISINFLTSQNKDMKKTVPKLRPFTEDEINMMLSGTYCE